MLGKNKEAKNIVNSVMSEKGKSYREKAIEKTPSNNGWYRCLKCGKSYRLRDMDADHINPKSRGGSDSRVNMQLICKHCNRSKGASMKDTRADYRRSQKDDKETKKELLKLAKFILRGK